MVLKSQFQNPLGIEPELVPVDPTTVPQPRPGLHIEDCPPPAPPTPKQRLATLESVVNLATIRPDLAARLRVMTLDGREVAIAACVEHSGLSGGAWLYRLSYRLPDGRECVDYRPIYGRCVVSVEVVQ